MDAFKLYTLSMLVPNASLCVFCARVKEILKNEKAVFLWFFFLHSPAISLGFTTFG